MQLFRKKNKSIVKFCEEKLSSVWKLNMLDSILGPQAASNQAKTPSPAGAGVAGSPNTQTRLDSPSTYTG